jgi:hypothetical protein
MRIRAAVLLSIVAACADPLETRATTIVDTSPVLACEDQESFRATLAGPDTTAFLGCAAYSTNPGGWVLTLYDGPHTMPRYTLDMRRAERPLTGTHAVGDQTGIVAPRFTASLLGARNFTAVDGSVQIISSSVGYVQGKLDLIVQQPALGSWTLTGTFAATCAQRPTLGC